MDEIAVLIPCYNEAQTIEKVVKDFKNVLPMLFEECFAISMQNATL